MLNLIVTFPKLSILLYCKGGECGVRASNYKARGLGLNHTENIVFLSKALKASQNTCKIPRKWWFQPDITEKVMTGTASQINLALA